MATTKYNRFETAARAAKVAKLVAVLKAAGCTVEQAELMQDEQWTLAARAAKVNVPSFETRAAVINVIRKSVKPSIRFEGRTWVARFNGIAIPFLSHEYAARWLRTKMVP